MNAPADDQDEDAGERPAAGDAVFGTETMAELCVRQGRVRDALAIYRGLIAGPADEQRRARWRERLEALERPRGAEGQAPRPTVTATSAVPPRGGGTVPSGARRLAEGAGGLRGVIHRLPVVIRQPVRSGQIVYAEKNDLIVLAPVNPGAQLIADGNIHIYSRLSGRAVAGAHGAAEARIYCQKLDAELVGIDAAYLLADDLPRERRGLPAQIFLQDGRCVVAGL